MAEEAKTLGNGAGRDVLRAADAVRRAHRAPKSAHSLQERRYWRRSIHKGYPFKKDSRKRSSEVTGAGQDKGIWARIFKEETMQTTQSSHRHHYIPVWYQKGFLAPGKTSFKILDMHPDQFKDASGRVRGIGPSILSKGADAHFWESDLYSIPRFGKMDDVIERMLFGAIDTQGKRAIKAWLNEDHKTIHETYLHVYEFMDALRLRTPKGLRFISSLARRKQTQLELMLAMQELRRMHCLMWTEGFPEIAKAPEGSSGSIFSDHPVVMFNRHAFPGDPKIPAGYDPHLHWQGTQTLFPFDKEHLYILTHNEYARSPGPGKALKERTNSRYFDDWQSDSSLRRLFTHTDADRAASKRG